MGELVSSTECGTNWQDETYTFVLATAFGSSLSKSPCLSRVACWHATIVSKKLDQISTLHGKHDIASLVHDWQWSSPSYLWQKRFASRVQRSMTPASSYTVCPSETKRARLTRGSRYPQSHQIHSTQWRRRYCEDTWVNSVPSASQRQPCVLSR